ncbi:MULTISPECIES: TonB-dependent receptor [unclassified Lentimicrobium]|uniref:TonB-dependent receptor n=1 Tax=unclassified Lentimicrobium TaxID=2677434 RepID=UPI0015574F75|nr:MULTISPECIES: TonB-dependent receptor [unclassified Lentimicrobium]NPD45323.1 TonB-dependent receptor [Lentimicrobium sp. S6]NPD84378.1 TonB-dependent receptor [Lentimicrobium sp. L6]
MKKLYILFSLLMFTSIIFAQKGEVRGIVNDAKNNDPIPFANIIVEGTTIGSTSDLDGNFIITGLEPGYINLRVSYVGYQSSISSDILISNSKTPFIEIGLEPSQNELNEVVVKVDYLKKTEEAPLSMQSIGTKQIEGNAGSNRDISRVIQSFPGVGSTPAFRNDVIIRGGGPSENRFFLDGVEIPVLNHFSTQGASGGPVGIINADFIQTVDFYSGSFPAAKYNALSGILDFKQKEGSKDKTNFQVSLGASEAAFTVDGPIGDKTSYIFSVRRSYLQFLFSAIGLPFLPTFNDYQFKLKTNFNPKNQLTIISLGSLDQLSLNTGIENPDAGQEYQLAQIPVNNQWSYTIGGVYKHFFDNGYHTLVLSRNMLNNEFYKYPDNVESKDKIFDYKSRESENKFRYELNYQKNGFKYNFGVNTEYAEYENQTIQQLFLEDSLFTLNYNTNINVIKYGLSGQVSKTILKNRLLVSLGLRSDGNNYNSKMANLINQLSPRLALSYSLTDQVQLNAGVGRYYQQPSYTTLGFRNNEGILMNENTAEYIGANHYNLGAEYRFNSPMTLSVEGFYKDYFQYPIDLVTGSSLANQGAEYSSVAGAVPAVFTGTGEAIGLEVLQRINFTNFTLLASYTYVRSKFTDINNDLVPSSWDSKHLLTLTGSKQFKKNWRAGFKWRYVGGLPYTPYDLETSANVEAWDARGQAYYNYGEINTLRYDPFHQLDLRIDKNYFFDNWSLMVYLDIQNVYNFKVAGQDYVIREKNPDGSYMTTNNGQDYVLQSVANESGTVLPTVGIMVKF